MKSGRPLRDVVQEVEAAAAATDPALPVSFSQAFSAEVERRLGDQLVFAWVLSLLGWIAFGLAAVGLSGLLAQAVSERTREFGIRLAIGAGRGRVIGLLLRQAAWIGVLGAVSGLALAAFGSRLIEAQLFGVTRLSLPVYLLSALALVAIVFIASVWPARSVTRIDPVEALRSE